MKYLRDEEVKFDGGVVTQPVFRVHPNELPILREVLLHYYKALKRLPKVNRSDELRLKRMFDVVNKYLMDNGLFT